MSTVRHPPFLVPVLLFAVAACTASAPASEPRSGAQEAPDAIAPIASHPFSVRDMLAMERLGDLQVSPDGTRALVNVRSTDLEANKGRTDVWSVDLANGAMTRLTSDPASDVNARWAPDGKAVYFLSSRSGSMQVHRRDASGGVAQVTDLPVGVSNLVVSPDGSRLAFTAEVYVDCADLACTAERIAAEEADPITGVVYDRLFVRHWDTWKAGRRSHLFVMPSAGGTPVDVTRGLDADVPSMPFGGPEEIAFAPDGEQIVFVARDAGAWEPWSTNFDLFAAPCDGSTPPRKLTENPAWDTLPVFSPDGKTLAYAAMARPGFEADRFVIHLMDWPSGNARALTAGWDRSVREMAFTPDGRRLLATAQSFGQVSIFGVDVPSGQVEELVAQGSASAPALASGRLVFLKNDLAHPNEVWTAGPDGSEPAPLSHVNDVRVEAARTGEYEQFVFTGAGGERVHAYVVKPVDFDPEEHYPVAFLIHGGPQGSFGNNFHYRWNPQFYAGAGYAAVMVDFHGSTGYGQAFTDSISGDWGGAPLEDLKAGLAAALERYPFLDGDHVCALGASYGGYMINWIASQWPDRFRCLVNHDGVFDIRSMYYSTEELWFPEWEFGGGPYYERPEAYERFDPVRFVDRWQTPMLVVHGGLDYRVPLEQGLGAFTALQRRGIESRFLYFPDENHWVLSPHNSLQWHEEVLRWIDAHCTGGS